MEVQQSNIIWIIVCSIIISYTNAYTQSSNIGTPPISNYNKKDYKGNPQNWDIDQGENGLLYFANSEGLLEFDGITWRKYEVGNQTVIRSVKIASDGKIFVGAQGELGYFYPNERGHLQYHSLKHYLPEVNQNFADVWDIEILDDQVFFRTGNMILKYHKNILKIIYQGQGINILVEIENDIYFQDTERGLLKIENDSILPIPIQQSFPKIEISGILSYGKDTLLISTLQEGLFLYANGQLEEWRLNDDKLIKTSSVYCMVRINENDIAIGTSTGGIFIVNKNGQVIHHMDRSSGLQINNVLSLFIDQSNNLWTGLNNGIDFIEISSPFTYIFPDGALKSTGYAVRIHDGQIYFGTANGVYFNKWDYYYNPVDALKYKLLKHSEGQVWNLSVHGDDLLLNHHRGVFSIEENIAKKVSIKEGAWMQIPLSEDKLLSGHYTGLSILDRQEIIGWKETIDFKENWQESCRIIVRDEDGTIWVSHPYRGVFKVQLDKSFSKLESVQLYNSKDGFPSDLQIYVFKIGAEAVFCTKKGIYSFNKSKDRFEPNEKWNAIFDKNTRVRRLIEAPNGDIWFVTNEDVGLLEVTDGGVYKKVNKRTLPLLNDMLVNGFEEIYPYDQENVFIAQETGFIHYNTQKLDIDTSFNVLIRQVQSIHNDSILYGGNYPDSHQMPQIDYSNNALHFAFAATFFENIDHNQFQFYLEGYENKWSPWSSKSQIEYTNLLAGTYVFKVRAKNINGHISNVATYSFEVLPPWYATQLAFIIYILLIGGLVFSLVFIPKKKFEREKAALESEQKKTLLQKDQEHQLIEQQRQQQISKLEKEKLELQIRSKNQELASNTMHLTQKSEMLQKIKDDLQKIAKASDDEKISNQLNKIIRKVSADERLDKDWEQFAKHFDQVHSQFLQRLRLQHPKLTPKDHRLCAYLRMNLSSKEMASLLNISVRSVEVARYRLRKKLGIDGSVNLVEFMLEV